MSLITTVNPNPKQTFISDRVGSRLFVDDYNTARDYDSSTGKRELGLIDPQNLTVNLKPTFVDIAAGATETVLEKLIKSWNGTGQGVVQDCNPTAMEFAAGTPAGRIRDTEPSSTVQGTVAGSGSTINSITVGTGEGASFASHVGKVIEVPRTNSDAMPMRAHIRSVSGDVITTVNEMDEVPAAGGTVKVLEGFSQEFGGNSAVQRELIMAQDFGKGGSHRTVMWRTQSVSGLAISAGDKSTQSIDFEILGHDRTVDGSLQQVPVTIFGTYGIANI